jgi:NAD-specific glutamate dehydrogenase
METIEVDTLLKEIETQCDTLDSAYHAWTSITKPIYSLLTTWLFSRNYPNSEQQKSIRTVLKMLPQHGGKDFQNRHQNTINELKTHDVPAGLAQKIATLSEICSANEIVLSRSDHSSLQNAVVSYYALGEASCFLPIIRLLENRRSSGGWDPAAKAILQSRFLHLQGQLMEGIDLGPELPIGVDRLVQRLKIGRLQSLSEELDSITADAGDLASLIVANARALSRVKREYSATSPHIGTK